MPDGNVNQVIREVTGIDGCSTMEELLEKMKRLNPNDKTTHYGYLVLWSDGFLCSYVKQKENSVWILTIAVTDPTGGATPPFHTHCLAFGYW